MSHSNYLFQELHGEENFEPSTITKYIPFTQAKFYGDWQKFLNRKVRRFIVKKDEQPIAYFQLIKYPLIFNKSYLYIPYGPISLDLSGNFLNQFKNQLKEIAKQEEAVFVRLDFHPSIKEQKQKKFIKEYFFQAPKSTYHSAYFQPRREWFLDLDKSEEHLYEAMENNHRYSIRLSQRKEIETEIIDKDYIKYLDDFYDLMKITAERNGFNLHSKTYYQAIFEKLNNNYAYLTIAKYQKKILAINLIVIYDKVANYVFACTSNEERNRAPAYGAIWSAIKQAKLLGAKYFNFGGISSDDLPNPHWKGLTSFKKKFGGFEIHRSDFYDLINNRLIYLIYLIRKIIKNH